MHRTRPPKESQLLEDTQDSSCELVRVTFYCRILVDLCIIIVVVDIDVIPVVTILLSGHLTVTLKSYSVNVLINI